MSETKVLSKEDVDYLSSEADQAPAETVDLVRKIAREEAGVDAEATHIEVVDESGERQIIRVASIGSLSLKDVKDAMAVNSGSWQNQENK